MLGATECYFIDHEKVVSLGFGFTALGTKNLLPSDGDVLTESSLIDLKCSSKAPTSKHTFQLLLYYILGLHEFPEHFKHLKYIKLINPILGKVYSYPLADLDKNMLKTIEKEIIGYENSVI